MALAILLGVSNVAGCGKEFTSSDVSSYPQAPFSTTQDVIDYYAEALKYDGNAIKREDVVHEIDYTLADVTNGDTVAELKRLTAKAESILSQDDYPIDDSEALKVLSEDNFFYLKGVLDNVALTNSQFQTAQEALGYYFVDVTYDLQAQQPGEFRELVNLLPIDGAFKQDIFTNQYYVDLGTLENIVRLSNKYFLNNNIKKVATLNKDTCEFRVLDSDMPGGNIGFEAVTGTGIKMYINEDGTLSKTGEGIADAMAGLADIPQVDENGNPIDTGAIPEGDGAVVDSEVTNQNMRATEPNEEEPSDGNTTGEVEQPEQSDESVPEGAEVEEPINENIEAPVDGGEADGAVDGAIDGLGVLDDGVDTTSGGLVNNNPVKDHMTGSDVTIISENRKCQFDPSVINSAAGTAVSKGVGVPELRAYYSLSVPSGDISGYGIYPEGLGGLRLFGFDRSKTTGTATIRYVFKDSDNGDGTILGSNAYVTYLNITNGSDTAESVYIPKYLQTELEKLIDRSDRVIANDDIEGMLSGKIYEDVGPGVLRGFMSRSTGVNSYNSRIKQTLVRNMEENAYELLVEANTSEGPRDVDAYGTYRDTYLVAVQQQGQDFVIIDRVRVKREMTVEPSINPISDVEKRLVALNLSGEVTDEVKAQISTLLNELYTSATYRIGNVGEEGKKNGVTAPDGTKLNITRGMNQLFNTEQTMLDSTSREYMISQLQNAVLRYGANIGCEFRGRVTEYIGGKDDQVEFTTEELHVYEGQSKAYYVTSYYLLSNMQQAWVIDQRTVISDKVLDLNNETDKAEFDEAYARIFGQK